jgi:hypothetical protein
MTLSPVDDNGIRFVEGMPTAPLMASVGDANRIIEACYEHETQRVLLYPSNMTPAFFDLSSHEAGEILQKLRNYGVHLAVVCQPGTVQFSSRFGELLAEERRGRWFGVFDTRDAAVHWLRG